METLIFALVMEGCSALFFYLGLMLWKRERIDIIHNYHVKKVKERDKKGIYNGHGKGIGLMPELQEVLDSFPDKELLIHMNHGDVRTAEVLWTYLDDMSEERLQQITVYGNDEGLDYLREKNENIRVLSSKRLKEALLKYELVGWTGYIPDEIKNMEIHIPLKYAKFLWGWPNKFVERMESVNTKVVIVEGNGKRSEGFDTKESLENIPEGYSGYVWTNRIDIVKE